MKFKLDEKYNAVLEQTSGRMHFVNARPQLNILFYPDSFDKEDVTDGEIE
jgi:hypothetical protein